MLLPVNNVEGKQQLNDQSHYSTQQIKGNWVSVVRAYMSQGYGEPGFT